MNGYERGLISIVMPVYNTGQALRPCLDSVLAQSYGKWELIIVDDYSEDGSLELCRGYEKKDPRISVYTKENEGVSEARNFGLRHAKGEYLQFVDSDDALYPDACLDFVRTMQERDCDIVIAGFISMKTGEEKVPRPGFFENTEQFARQFEQYYHYKSNVVNAPWNKCYRRNIIKNEFKKKLSLGEDLLFNLDAFSEAGSICVIDRTVYEYHNEKDTSLAYRYREDGFEIETMLFNHVREFVLGQTGERQTPDYLYNTYCFGVKMKLTALVKKSGLGLAAGARKINQYGRMKEVRELAAQSRALGRKDRMLVWLMAHRGGLAVWMYYSIFAV